MKRGLQENGSCINFNTPYILQSPKFSFKKIVLCFGWAGFITLSLSTIYAFMIAYSSGYSAEIFINRYNEAHIEFVSILLVFPAMIYTVIYHNRQLKNEK